MKIRTTKADGYIPVDVCVTLENISEAQSLFYALMLYESKTGDITNRAIANEVLSAIHEQKFEIINIEIEADLGITRKT